MYMIVGYIVYIYIYILSLLVITIIIIIISYTNIIIMNCYYGCLGHAVRRGPGYDHLLAGQPPIISCYIILYRIHVVHYIE